MLVMAFAGLVALFVLLTVLPSRTDARQGDNSLGLYKAQLDELAQDLKRGQIDEAEARSARLEIERRILKAADKDTVSGGTAISPAVFYYGLAAFGVILSVVVYLQFGRPALPTSPAAVSELGNQPIREGGPTLNEALAMIKDRLEQEPDDRRGWQILATTARAASDLHTSEQAYAQLETLEPDTPEWTIRRLESMLIMSRGEWHPAIRLHLEKLFLKFPDHPAAAYYAGRLYLSDGDLEKTKTAWRDVLAKSDPTTAFSQSLRKELAALEGEGESAGLPGVTADQQQAVAAMSAEDQKAFIDQMVARLVARLADNPDDIAGWQMLARTYIQRGEKDKAQSAIEDAIKKSSDETREALKLLLDKIRENREL